MKIYSEFIVLHEDGPMPAEENFCPSFWQAPSFDADGDYYYDGIDGRWTNLQITKELDGGAKSTLRVDTYREHRLYDPSILEVADLQRYIDYVHNGRYQANQQITALNSLAVTSLIIETGTLQDYAEYLKTIHFFLVYTQGIVVSPREMDADAFQVEFLS